MQHQSFSRDAHGKDHSGAGHGAGSARRRGSGARERLGGAELRSRALPRALPPRSDPSAFRPRTRSRRRTRARSWTSCATSSTRVDSDKIDRDGHIPEEVVQELRDMGAFGIKIPREYGGLGLSQMSYIRAIGDGHVEGRIAHRAALRAPVDRPAAAAQAVRHRRAEEEVFPAPREGRDLGVRAHGDGCRDPIRRTCARRATLSEDGTHYILNGEKLWCTNGTRAELIVVMARTPDAIVNGKPKKQITAFIVETNWPGVEIVHRCALHGAQGDRERRHSLQQRARAAARTSSGAKGRDSSSRS